MMLCNDYCGGEMRAARYSQTRIESVDQNPDTQPSLGILPITAFPVVNAGDDLVLLISNALSDCNLSLQDGDVMVVAQKIVSLCEGRLLSLDDVVVSAAAEELASETDKDPRLVELILQESAEVIRKKPGVIIVRHRLGFVGANAGIDQSNIDHGNGECALLLPENPDLSAKNLRGSLKVVTGKTVGVVISDSMNRPWRLGTVGAAIGSAGIEVLEDRRGDADLYGRELKVTIVNRADAIAAAAVLVMGETTEQVPAAVVRGLPVGDSSQTARDCIRPLDEDMFL
jgi:coenzyme F420-0:L-glutamate ligase/coenzyme F420-1:gamma-L-glutamate ligase